MMSDYDGYLQEALAEAETRFGPRVPGWAMQKVMVGDYDHPQTLVSNEHKTITVRLTRHVESDQRIAKFQIGHEAIHCLTPVENMEVRFFEEGLAVSFSLY